MGKRSLDVLAAVLGLALLFPVFAAIAALIPFTSPGPALFSQVRLGRHGRPFRMYKFRSMVADASLRGAHVTSGGDPRITPFGCFLRRTKLDELPQLINVLKGDMSLVGPRPEVPEFAYLFAEQYRRILHVRPGITHRTTLAFRSEEVILADARVSDARGFYIDHVMPRKLAMYEECLQGPLLRDVWTILETVSPWKTTRAVTAGELMPSALMSSELMPDAPIISNVPAWPEPVSGGRSLGVPRRAPVMGGNVPGVRIAAAGSLANLLDGSVANEVDEMIESAQIHS